MISSLLGYASRRSRLLLAALVSAALALPACATDGPPETDLPANPPAAEPPADDPTPGEPDGGEFVISVRFHNPDLEARGQSSDEADQSEAGLSFAFAPAQRTAAPPQADGVIRQDRPVAALNPLLPAGTFDDVTRIVVDIFYAESGAVRTRDIVLTQLSENEWRGVIAYLPADVEFRFEARAYEENTLSFGGSATTTITVDNQSVVIPLASVQDGATIANPRIFKIVYPSAFISGEEKPIVFTIEADAGQQIAYEISSDDGSTPFTPAAGSVGMTSTVADFVTLYRAPEVTEETTFSHRVGITSEQTASDVTIEFEFVTTVLPPDTGSDVRENIRPSVLFSPVIIAAEQIRPLGADHVIYTAYVSDDSPPEDITYQWSYEPNTGTPEASFGADGVGNPGILQDYTIEHQGNVVLTVTDGDGNATTLYYAILPGQYADPVDNGAVDGIKRLSAGIAHTCILDTDGKVRCWGHNAFGQLGYGDSTNRGDASSRLPYMAGDVPLFDSEEVDQLAVGGGHTCVLLKTGEVRCWGQNNYGQLGYGHTSSIGDGEDAVDGGFALISGLAKHIAAGASHTCVVMANDTSKVQCWGRNNYGQLGYGHTASVGDNEPVSSELPIDVGGDVTALALGNAHTCALLSDGRVRCWGLNNHGQLGIGSTQTIGDQASDTLQDALLDGPVRQLSAGQNHNCAIFDTGAMRCWGLNSSGQLGIGNNVSTGSQAPEDQPAISLDGLATAIAAGDTHTCALVSTGDLKCWGYNGYGELGYGSTGGNHTAPPANGVNLDGSSAYQLTAGSNYTCALRSNGGARCWGRGTYGRLGQGNSSNVSNPAVIEDIEIFEP